MTENIEVLTHSSIRITGEPTIYVDPFHIEQEVHDADIIFITHDHFDHFSVEDIEKVRKEDTVLVVPEKMKGQAGKASCSKVVTVKPGTKEQLKGIEFEAVAAYNSMKPFHPKWNGWVGYVLTVNGVRIYIAGDTDMTKDNQLISCDVAMVPIGGKFTMDASQAAELVNVMKPKVAIPTHYGSIAGTKEAEEDFRAKVDPSIPVEIKMQKY